MSENVVGIAISDIHLSHTPPIARSAEPDWYAAMARPLDQVVELQEEFRCPVFCCGDIFHHHNSPPELINFAIEHLPHMYAVPGQHDLPLHRYEDVHKSAYWTLVQAHAIDDVEPSHLVYAKSPTRACLYGFPWGSNLSPLPKRLDGELSIALVHKYVWVLGHQYPGAPEENAARKVWDELPGYDVVLTGDNHHRFLRRSTGRSFFNCGCLIPRTSDEREFKPAVGLIHSDSTITVRYLDCSQDKWADVDPAQEVSQDVSPEMGQFLSNLDQIQTDYLDFRMGLRRYVDDPDNKVGEGVKRLILEALGD